MAETDEEQPDQLLQGSPALQGERVVFTGTLASMTHQKAWEFVELHGGQAAQHVSRQTTLLVIGEEGWPLEADGSPSVNLSQAQELITEGTAIQIIKESDWLSLIELRDPGVNVDQLYTPAMLTQMLNVPVSTIRRWERQGLIKPVRKIFRLPYFSFQEVASVRRLSTLLESGVSPRDLENSLQHLGKFFSEVDQPLSQLTLLSQDAQLLLKDERGLIDPRQGQRVFDFGTEETAMPELADEESFEGTIEFTEHLKTDEPEDRSSDEWFQTGCRFLDAGEAKPAIEAYRMALLGQPDMPEGHLHLAEALYLSGNTEGALERYYAAVEWDHDYIEAWTQLGCLHNELGDAEAALHAFEIALRVHPDYPDAHLHIAEVLNQLNRVEEAVPHWKVYLEFDELGPWAELARQRLQEYDDDQLEQQFP
ncbi:MAG: tetratricopeptide repeat protein [Planctomycetota bacterium]